MARKSRAELAAIRREKSFLETAIPEARDELTRAQRARLTAEEICEERLETLCRLRRRATKLKMNI